MWRHTPGLMGKILARSLRVLGILASLPTLLVCALPIDSIAGDGIDRAGLVGGLLLFLFFSPLASVIYFACWYAGGAAYRKTVVICVSLVWALPLLGLTLYVAGPGLLAPHAISKDHLVDRPIPPVTCPALPDFQARPLSLTRFTETESSTASEPNESSLHTFRLELGLQEISLQEKSEKARETPPH